MTRYVSSFHLRLLIVRQYLQEYLDSVLERLNKTKKLFDHIVVLHNYYNTTSSSDLFKLAESFITGCFDVVKQVDRQDANSPETIW